MVAEESRVREVPHEDEGSATDEPPPPFSVRRAAAEGLAIGLRLHLPHAVGLGLNCSLTVLLATYVHFVLGISPVVTSLGTVAGLGSSIAVHFGRRRRRASR